MHNCDLSEGSPCSSLEKKKLDCELVFSLPNILHHVLYCYMYWSASKILLNTATFKIISFLYHSTVWFSLAVHFYKQKEQPSTKNHKASPSPTRGHMNICFKIVQAITLEARWIWHSIQNFLKLLCLIKLNFHQAWIWPIIFNYVSQHFTCSSNKSIFKCPQWSGQNTVSSKNFMQWSTS